MCGIVGILNFENHHVSKRVIKKMTDALSHRGPDDINYYFNTTIGLGHRRLSIIDLSSSGRQPMSNEDATVWLVFNGEIYNYIYLKDVLKSKGHKFKSKTDSEVIIHSYEEWGYECLARFNGMWAFTLWDTKKKVLFCARDRFGIKPFYYHHSNRKFVFASEIQSILKNHDIPAKPNESIIFDYIGYPFNDYIDHSDDTFFLGIKRLMPAHYMVINKKGDLTISRYWDLDPEQKFDQIGDSEAASRFYHLLEDSVRLRLQSDVPVGTCLSGGIDSSSIVCIVNDLITRNLAAKEIIGECQKTFSAGFNDKDCDEREFINAIVKKTKVKGYTVLPTGNDLVDYVSRFIQDQGEPVVSSSQFAGWMVMRLVSQNGVKVVLNGQGADEILAGYGSYFHANFRDLFKRMNLYQLKNEINKCSLYHGYSSKWLMLSLLKYFNPIHPFQWKRKIFGESDNTKYPNWLNKDFSESYGHDMKFLPKYKGYLDQSLYHFLTLERLPSLLRYEDRNSMAFSIEARVPFLDHRLVEFCFALPSIQKIRNGVGKVVLRNALNGKLPKVVHRRIKKIGFQTPEIKWLQTDFKENIDMIINSGNFKQRGYFNVREIVKHFQNFFDGEVTDTRLIWKCINLELWMQKYFSN